MTAPVHARQLESAAALEQAVLEAEPLSRSQAQPCALNWQQAFRELRAKRGPGPVMQSKVTGFPLVEIMAGYKVP